MWLGLTLEGVSIVDFFRSNHLHDIAVYGYGKVGKLLCREIKKCDDINLVAVIDKNYGDKEDGITVISPDASIPKHEILICAYTDVNYVRNKLVGKSDNIVGFDELLKGFGYGNKHVG